MSTPRDPFLSSLYCGAQCPVCKDRRAVTTIDFEKRVVKCSTPQGLENDRRHELPE